jgi:uncharacterized damage-inducible protein DinB
MPNLKPEPWLRGTHTDIPAVPRAVIHAIELAAEDLQTWCSELSAEELHSNVAKLPSVAFQLRHIARSVDRLLTYAEGRPLSPDQLAALRTEAAPNYSRDELFAELQASLIKSLQRIQNLAQEAATLGQSRTVGRQILPTTVAGLLIHIAEHTQRHVGQAITTAKLIRSQRPYAQPPAKL